MLTDNKINGVFMISLDFEMFWGIRNKKSIESYKKNLNGVENAVNNILEVLYHNSVHATWATVGFLFFKSFKQLKTSFPQELPSYEKKFRSPYIYINRYLEKGDKYYFANDLIKKIESTDGQEVGTHTFSHYYCLEKGQTLEQFKIDLISALSIAKQNDIQLTSLVFPRNQINRNYLKVLTDLSIECYRGIETNEIYKLGIDNKIISTFKRLFRLLDTYINLTGYNTYDIAKCKSVTPFNFPSSRFLRPYSKNLVFINQLKVNRIKKSMKFAAKNNRLFHIWFHPHNFGINIQENINNLLEIISYFKWLEKRYNMKSMNMGELSQSDIDVKNY